MFNTQRTGSSCTPRKNNNVWAKFDPNFIIFTWDTAYYGIANEEQTKCILTITGIITV